MDDGDDDSANNQREDEAEGLMRNEYGERDADDSTGQWNERRYAEPRVPDLARPSVGSLNGQQG